MPANANTDQRRMSAALIGQILVNPAVSNWLKDSYHAAKRRDCVDALRDSELLAAMLRFECDRTLGAA